jgi:uncharacterized membrane protein
MTTTTALPTNGSGAQASREDPLPNILGWGSLGLGVPATTAPGLFAESIGVKDDAETRTWTLLVGLREFAHAGGILALERPRPVRALWSRVAGDMMDLALLSAAWRSKRENTFRLAAATGAVVGIGIADVVASIRFTRNPDVRMREPEVPVRTSITLRAPRDQVYSYWRNFANFPSFMAHVESVEPRDDGRSHWVAKAPLGKVEWDAEIVQDRPGELIAWRSVEGSDIQHSGVIGFVDAPGGRGTEIHVNIHVAAPAGRVGMTVAKLLGEEPTVQVKDDLRRFKQIMETGEIVRSEGSPEGPFSRRHLKQRPAQPPEQPVTEAGARTAGRP